MSFSLFLLLANNTLSGLIPSNLSHCANLKVFHVSHNVLVGEIPTMLRTLSKLQFFAIHKNNLTGSFPPSFGNLSFLEKFLQFTITWVGLSLILLAN